MNDHKVFKRILSDGNILVFVPSLNFASIVQDGKTIPDFIKSEKTACGQKVFQKDFLPTGVTLLTTNKCNLLCCYCYGSFKPTNISFLPVNIGKKIIDFLIENALRLKTEKINVSYFGGEPTQHWDFLEEVNEYAQKKTKDFKLKLRTGISTNGCITTAQSDWLIHNIDSIQISFDGFKEIQDRHRDGSFDQCFETARYFYKNGKVFNIRSTISNLSVSCLEEIIKFFIANFPKSKIALEPLSPCGRLSDEGVKEPEAKILFQKLEKIYSKYGNIIKTTLCQFSNSYSDNFCGVTQPNFFITPDQKIVACSRIESSQEDKFFEYGYVCGKGNIVIDYKKIENIRKININNIEKCNSCFSNSTCKGGCPAQKLFLFGEDFYLKPLPEDLCNNICSLTEKCLLEKLNYKLS